jgi:hypothetical protein
MEKHAQLVQMIVEVVLLLHIVEMEHVTTVKTVAVVQLTVEPVINVEMEDAIMVKHAQHVTQIADVPVMKSAKADHV